MERSKKKAQLWKKAIVHFSLCFVMGFFTGFAPTGKTSSPVLQKYAPEPVEAFIKLQPETSVNRSLVAETETTQEPSATKVEKEPKLMPRRLLIIVTPTNERDKFQNVYLRRLANTMKLVPPPLLWIVVEKQTESDQVSRLLRKTAIMYRHLVFKENFTDPEAELDHQRNVALKHIEQHRLSGIVHFAGLSNVYDLGFFDELRDIEVFGTWPMAFLTANNKKVRIEGPVCDSSQVIGWHLKKTNNETEEKPSIHVSSFGFNSSILWDPERWGRPSSLQQTSQNSIKFVKQVVLEDETKLQGIPAEDCSKIMIWSLDLPKPPSQGISMLRR
ncbi:beta-1,4-xylosyltransferase IRX9 [Mangifera indica]|uniref:beta-1,4-xylosyltransferase IRX9 n=1 Tax=Mangifera indica TaxID=29780 RepID=UPI001CFA3E14|nr:beta-1,4-xylosyltransferase IRX9 [Mangifera indica]